MAGQRADLVCRPIVANLKRGCSVPFPSNVFPDVVGSLGVRIAPTKEGVLQLAENASLADVSHDRQTVSLLVRRPPTPKKDLLIDRVSSLLRNDPTRIVVLIVLRPLVLQQCNGYLSCHLGLSRTLSMFERFYRRIEVDQSARQWSWRCSMCQAPKSPD